MHPRLWARGVSAAAALLLFACSTTSQQVSASIKLDWLIENGQVYDGTGSQGQYIDIGIAADKIVFMGDAEQADVQAEQRIDASGLIVAPGFIDPHTHLLDDLSSDDPDERTNLPYAFQGVTSVVIENDGYGPFKAGAVASELRNKGIGTNAAFLVGFGPVRKAVLGEENRAPATAELDQMRTLVRKGMCEGALGFSTSLYYTPQNFAQTEEVIALAKVAGELGGIYESHVRDESSYSIGVRAAIAEAIEIGQVAGMPTHIAHIKALGPSVWGASQDIIAMIDAARTAGQKVTADQYPWEASGTRVSNALVPRWALDGGLPGLRQRIEDPDQLPRIRADMIKGLERRGGPEKLLFTESLGNANVPMGITLAEFARQRDISPLDAAIAILKEGDSRVASFVMNDRDINTFAVQNWVVTSSDGSTGHPRKYASFPEAYQRFVKRDKLFDMARFIRRSSGQTADILGLENRGYIRTGYFADIVIFDPEKFAARADYANPTRVSKGVTYLFINGQAAIADGKATGRLAGKPLLKDASSFMEKCAGEGR